MFATTTHFLVLGPFAPVFPAVFALTQYHRKLSSAHHAFFVGASMLAFGLSMSPAVREASGAFTRTAQFR